MQYRNISKPAIKTEQRIKTRTEIVNKKFYEPSSYGYHEHAAVSIELVWYAIGSPAMQL